MALELHTIPAKVIEDLAILLEIDLLVFGNRTSFRRLQKALQQPLPADENIKPCSKD